MSTFVIIFTLFLSFVRADSNVTPKNVITVPPNCPEGQEYINGACRDVWLRQDNDLRNVVTVPPNCPGGQQWINNQCREIWRTHTICPQNLFSAEEKSNILASILCKPFSERVKRQQGTAVTYQLSTEDNKNIISVPNRCPAGYRPDALGVCREIYD